MFHSLRHSFGTWLWETGANPRVIQELMRHRDLKMTNRYTDTAGLAMNAAVGNLPSFDLTAGGGIHKYAHRFSAKRVKTCRRVAKVIPKNPNYKPL